MGENRSLFGREPAVVLGFVGAVLTVAATLGLPFLDAGAVAAIMALLTAVVTAAFTRPVVPALGIGILTAGVALFAEYGVHASEALVAGLTGLVVAGFALFAVRPQVTPKDGAVGVV